MGKGIDTLCNAISELPPTDSTYLLVVACGAVGRSPDEEEPDIKSIEVLRKRLTVLVDKVGVDEPFLVQSLLFYLIEYWAGFADPDQTSDAVAGWSRLDATLDDDLITPEEAREHKGSDESILWTKNVADREKRNSWIERKQAETVLKWLRQLKVETLNARFWQNFKAD